MSWRKQPIRVRSVEFFLAATVFILVGALLRNYFFASGAVEYYVSPTGNDSNVGSLQEPFKTITKAAAVIRSNRPAEGAVVYLRGGSYKVSQTVALDAADSGTANGPVIYKAYQTEKPIIDGTIDLPTPVPASGNLYSVDMSQVSGVDFRTSGITNLLWNGAAQTLARYPNRAEPNFSTTDPWTGQFLFAASDTPASKTQLKYASSPVSTANWAGANAVVFSGPNYWDSNVKISAVNTATRTLTFESGTSYNIVSGNRFYVENAKEFLDQNGEWFYDKNANKLFLYLNSAPKITDTFSVVRTGDIFSLSNVSNVSIEGLILRGSAGAGFNVRASNGSEGVKIRNNEIAVTAREGIRAGGYITNLTVSGNNIHDVGWDGVYLQQDVSYFKNLTGAGNEISSNVITKAGNKWRAKSGIEIYSVGTRIANNEIHDLPRMGIFFRGNDNVIEYNRVYNLNQETQDSGGIYMYGRSWLTRGNIVRNNYLYDVGGYGVKNGAWQYPYYTFGVYFDDFSSGNIAQNNVVARSGQAGLIIHGGRDNRIENNFLIDSYANDTLAMIGVNNQSSHLPTMWNELSQMVQNGYDKTKYFAKYPELSTIKQSMTNEELYANNRVTKNILYNISGGQQYAVNSRQFRQGLNNVSDNNVFWSDVTYNILDSYTNNIYTLNQWKGFGLDQHSLVVDPRFSGISSHNFTFTGSGIAALGISQIDTRLTGPRLSVQTTPLVEIASPLANESVSGSAVFAATVSDTTSLSSVTFKIDGTRVAVFKPGSIFRRSIDTSTYQDGLHVFNVVAVNADGSVGTASATFLVSNRADDVKPQVSLTSPADGDSAGRLMKISATATDDTGVVKVEFYLDGALFKVDTLADFSTTWNTRKADKGKHQIYAKAYDAAGNTGISNVVTVIR